MPEEPIGERPDAGDASSRQGLKDYDIVEIAESADNEEPEGDYLAAIDDFSAPRVITAPPKRPKTDKFESPEGATSGTVHMMAAGRDQAQEDKSSATLIQRMARGMLGRIRHHTIKTAADKAAADKAAAQETIAGFGQRRIRGFLGRDAANIVKAAADKETADRAADAKKVRDQRISYLAANKGEWPEVLRSARALPDPSATIEALEILQSAIQRYQGETPSKGIWRRTKRILGGISSSEILRDTTAEIEATKFNAKYTALLEDINSRYEALLQSIKEGRANQYGPLEEFRKLTNKHKPMLEAAGTRGAKFLVELNRRTQFCKAFLYAESHMHNIETFLEDNPRASLNWFTGYYDEFAKNKPAFYAHLHAPPIPPHENSLKTKMDRMQKRAEDLLRTRTERSDRIAARKLAKDELAKQEKAKEKLRLKEEAKIEREIEELLASRPAMKFTLDPPNESLTPLNFRSMKLHLGGQDIDIAGMADPVTWAHATLHRLRRGLDASGFQNILSISREHNARIQREYGVHRFYLFTADSLAFSQSQLDWFYRNVLNRAEAHEGMVLHCTAGLGRTGTLLSSLLVRQLIESWPKGARRPTSKEIVDTAILSLREREGQYVKPLYQKKLKPVPTRTHAQPRGWSTVEFPAQYDCLITLADRLIRARS